MAVRTAKANGLELAYEQIGDPGHPPILLIMGLGSQMISWSDEFCEQLAERGFFVTRFDNRDVGLSTHFTEMGVSDPAAFFSGEAQSAPYLVEDMADDAASLLDALSLAPAHVVGVSMGGMIAQALAINHPASVRSLTSIMSTPSLSLGAPTDEALAVLMAPPATNREDYIEQSVRTFAVIGSPGFPYNEKWRRTIAAKSYDRDPDPSGAARQLLAVISSPDRTPGLQQLDVPALVIHGMQDPLCRPEAGEATAAAIPGAQLVREDGMGHDLPEALWSEIIGHIEAVARRADGG
jgi:pimeloyl-ACP methyl ester carboxylesterase